MEVTSASGTLIFAPGQTSTTVTVTVAVLGDRLGEADETFVVNLSGPTNATVSDGRGDRGIVIYNRFTGGTHPTHSRKTRATCPRLTNANLIRRPEPTGVRG